MPIYRSKRKSKTTYTTGILKVLKNSVRFVEDGSNEIYEFNHEDVPEYIDPACSGQPHSVAISEKGDRILSARPVSGTFQVKFTGFAAPKDQPPVPKKKEFQAPQGNRTWPIQEHFEFTPLLEITRGKHKGQIVPFNLWYEFNQYEDTRMVVLPESDRKSDRQRMDFLELAGYDFNKDSIEYSDNVLPQIEAFLLGKKKEFILIMDNSWPQDMKPGLDD